MIISNATPSTRLNRRCVIMGYTQATEKDVLGQYPVVESEIATVWCGVTPQTGSMLSGRPGDTVLTNTTHKVTIRYRTDLLPSNWLMIDGVRYDILYILDPYLRHEVLEIFCEVREYGRGKV